MATQAAGQIIGDGIIGFGGGGFQPLSADGVAASVDLNFATNQGFNNGTTGTAVSMVTCTRAAPPALADNSGGTWFSFGPNVPRQTDKGLLVEESRTNPIRNNSMQGAAAGTPGTLPTNWIVQGSSLSQTVVGTGTENGIDYIDLRFFGTSGSGQDAQVVFEATTTIASSGSGQVWTNSVFVKLVGGSLANITSAGLRIDEFISGTFSAGTNDNQLIGITGATLGSQRHSFSYTTTTASNSVVSSILFYLANSSPIDFTIRIGWPQMELATFATSPIRTTGASVTRAGDLVSLTSLPTMGAAATLFASGVYASPIGNPANQWIAELNSGSTANRLDLIRINSSGGFQSAATNNSSSQVGNLGTIVQGATVKLAVAAADVSLTGQAGANNGTAANYATSLAWPPTTNVNSLLLGSYVGGASFMDGYIQRVAVWANNRISNAGLQTLTFIPPTCSTSLNFAQACNSQYIAVVL